MPAGVAKGSVPEKTGKQTSSKAENAEVDAGDPVEEITAKAEVTETELDDSDLKEFEESKKVPYSRFKEVNEKKKEYEGKISAMENKLQDEITRVTAQYEAKLSAIQQAKSEAEPDGIV